MASANTRQTKTRIVLDIGKIESIGSECRRGTCTITRFEYLAKFREAASTGTDITMDSAVLGVAHELRKRAASSKARTSATTTRSSPTEHLPRSCCSLDDPPHPNCNTNGVGRGYQLVAMYWVSQNS